MKDIADVALEAVGTIAFGTIMFFVGVPVMAVLTLLHREGDNEQG